MDLQRIENALRGRSRLVAAGAAAALALTTVIATSVLLRDDSPSGEGAETGASSALAVPVETIGEESVDGEQPGSSWPGEVFSAGDVDVQPPREGTVAEWKVSVGDRVQRGQVIGRMFASPSSPEFTATLAEAAQALAEARAELEAQVAFTDARKKQLAALRTSLQQANNGSAARATNSDVALRVETVRDFSAQAVRAIYLHVTNREGEDPIRLYRDDPRGFTVRYRTGVGRGSEAAKAEFSRDIVALMKGIIRNDDVADISRQFLRSADALVASSADLDGTEEVPGVRDPMGEFAETVEEQRAEVFEKIEGLNEARNGSADVNADVSGTLLEVDEQLLEADRELSLARSNLQAAQAAYNSINEAVGTDVSIVAPQSGAVSALFKPAGEYVEPGSAVASVNAGADKTIRFRIPGNVTPPKAGDQLTAVRPGFAKDAKRITILGVAESLDRNGSRVADASFAQPVEWPVHSSVRVTAGPGQATAPPLVSLTAIWFDDQGRANVWKVGDDDRIEAKLVKTGRTLGNKVELLEGGDPGTRIVSVAGPGLRAGMKLPKASEAPEDPGTEPAGDGHDHEH
jgi:multidrug efflux pump subunit AcrA (membrane-fusion protein)